MKKNYDSPQIEVIEIQVEKGFAESQLPTLNDGGVGF